MSARRQGRALRAAPKHEHPRPLTDAERRLAVLLVDLAIDAWERDEAANERPANEKPPA